MAAPILSSLTLLLASAGGVQEAKPPVDRSGEATLLRLFDSVSKLTSAKASISTFSREDKKANWVPEAQISVWMSGNKYRTERCDMWGAGPRIVCDGKNVLVDYLDASVKAESTAAKPLLFESHRDLAFHGSGFNILNYLRSGRASIDKLVAKTEKVILEHRLDGSTTVFFNTKEIGKTWILFREVGSEIYPLAFEYDDIPQQYRWMEEWGETWDVDPNRLTVQVIDWDLKPKFGPDDFSVVAPKFDPPAKRPGEGG